MDRRFFAAFALAALLLTGCGGEKDAVEATPETIPVLTEAPTMAPLETEAPAETTEATEAPTETTVPTTEATLPPETTVPQETEPGVAGKIANTPTVNVRKGPSVHTAAVKKLRQGDPVRVTESLVLDSVVWAHTEDGWICADYLELEGTMPGPSQEADGARYGIIYKTESVNVRQEPDINSSVVEKLKRNDVVLILETRKVGPGVWGRIEKGWLSMDYVDLLGQEAPEQSQEIPAQTEAPGTETQPQANGGGMAAPPETQPTYPQQQPPQIDGPFEDDGPHRVPVPQGKPCQHPSWKLWKHFDEVWITKELYVCQCGEESVNLPGWEYHCALHKDDPENHKTYTYSSEKVLARENTDWWECEVCGVVVETHNGQKP